MRKWSNKSLRVRATLDERLQGLFDEILENYADVSLIEGYRGKQRQNEYFAKGVTKVQYPDSKHNTFPSKAVDFQPYPYPEDDRELWASFAYVAGVAKVLAQARGFEIRWGGDWDQDGDLTDNNFDDLFHIEVVEP